MMETDENRNGGKMAFSTAAPSLHMGALTDPISRRSIPAIKSPHRRYGTIRRLNVVLNKALSVGGKNAPDLDEETDPTLHRCKPESLIRLCHVTKFTKKELQLIYRGFKQGCPTGAVSLEQFKEIYSQFFPQGAYWTLARADPNQYAIYVFNTFDKDKNGRISFEEFVIGLSTISRGSTEEKLRWVFNLYDVDRDGLLTKKDIEKIITSIYGMMGTATDPPVDANTVQRHIDYMYEKMDKNHDGVITLNEFLDACQKDEAITDSVNLFDTRLQSAKLT